MFKKMKKFNFLSKSPTRLESTSMLSPPEKLIFSRSPDTNSSAYYKTTPTHNQSLEKKSNLSRRELRFSNYDFSPDAETRIVSALTSKNSSSNSKIRAQQVTLKNKMNAIEDFVTASAEMLATKKNDPGLREKQKEMLSYLMTEKSKLQGDLTKAYRAKTLKKREHPPRSPQPPPSSTQFSRLSELLSEMQTSVTSLVARGPSHLATRGKIFDLFETFKNKLWSEFFAVEPEIQKLEQERKDLENQHMIYMQRLNQQMSEKSQVEQSRIEDMSVEKSNLLGELEKLRGEVNGLRVACDTKDKLIAVLQNQEKEVTQYKEFSIQNSELKKALLKAGRLIKEKETQLIALQEKLQQERTSSENSISELKEKIKAVGEEFYKTEMRLQPEKLLTAFEEDKDRYLKVIEDLQIQQASYQNDISILNVQKLQLEEQLNKSSVHIQELSSFAHTSIKPEDFECLQLQLETELAKNSKLQLAFDNLTVEHRLLETQFATNADSLELQQQIAQLQLDVEETEEQKLILQQKLDSSTRLSEAKFAEKKKGYKKKIESVQTEVLEYKDTLHWLQRDVNASAEQKKTALETKEQLKKEVQQISDELSVKEILVSDLESQIESLVEKWKQSSSLLDALVGALGNPADALAYARSLVSQQDVSRFKPVKKLQYKGQTFLIAEDAVDSIRFLPVDDHPCDLDNLELFKSEAEVCIDMLLTGDGSALDKVTQLIEEQASNDIKRMKEIEMQHSKELGIFEEKVHQQQIKLEELTNIYKESKDEVHNLKEMLQACEDEMTSPPSPDTTTTRSELALVQVQNSDLQQLLDAVHDKLKYTKTKYKTKVQFFKEQYEEINSKILETSQKLGLSSNIESFLQEVRGLVEDQQGIDKENLSLSRSVLVSPRPSCDEALMVRRLEHQGRIWCLFNFADTQAYWAQEQEFKNYEGPIPDLDPDSQTLLLQIRGLKSENEKKISSMLSQKVALTDQMMELKQQLESAQDTIDVIDFVVPGNGQIEPRLKDIIQKKETAEAQISQLKEQLQKANETNGVIEIMVPGDGPVEERLQNVLRSKNELKPIKVQDIDPQSPVVCTSDDEISDVASSSSYSGITTATPQELKNLIGTVKSLTAANEELESTLSLQESQLKLLKEERKKSEEKLNTENVSSNIEYLKELFITFVSKLPAQKGDSESILRVLFSIFEMSKQEIAEITEARSKLDGTPPKKSSILSGIFSKRNKK